MTDITPSPLQLEAVRAIVAWYKGGRSTPQIFYLAGYAGSGKSTIFKLVLQELRDAGMKKHCLATFTGKAASVLRKKGNWEAQTIHSLQYIRHHAAQDGWILNVDGDASDADLIALDECSMVDEPTGLDTLSFGKKVLVMGDPGQLPPVSGQGFFTNREPDFFLHEVHRQAAASPIIRLATLAREGKQLPLGEWDAGELGRAKVLMLDKDSQKLLYRPETQGLCGIHRVRIGYTQRIRRLRGFDGPRPHIGEPLIIRKNDRDKGIFNGTMATLARGWRPHKRRAGDDEIVSRYIRLDVYNEDSECNVDDLVVDPWMFDKHFDQTLAQPKYRKGVQWVDWGNMLTMHSAQGSEYPSVTIVDDSGAFGDDRHRHRYVGLTRGAEEVVFLRRS